MTIEEIKADRDTWKVRAEAAERVCDELHETVARLRAALEDIAKQKILDEVEDPVCCDYESGYTACVEVARAAISSENS